MKRGLLIGLNSASIAETFTGTGREFRGQYTNPCCSGFHTVIVPTPFQVQTVTSTESLTSAEGDRRLLMMNPEVRAKDRGPNGKGRNSRMVSRINLSPRS